MNAQLGQNSLELLRTFWGYTAQVSILTLLHEVCVGLKVCLFNKSPKVILFRVQRKILDGIKIQAGTPGSDVPLSKHQLQDWATTVGRGKTLARS